MSIQTQTPSSLDILLGRDKLCWHHKGNRWFRSVVAKHQNVYHQAKSRDRKVEIVAMIVDEIKASGSRFLKRNARTNAWEEVDRKLCVSKVGHALRHVPIIAQRRSKKVSVVDSLAFPPKHEHLRNASVGLIIGDSSINFQDTHKNCSSSLIREQSLHRDLYSPSLGNASHYQGVSNESFLHADALMVALSCHSHFRTMQLFKDLRRIAFQGLNLDSINAAVASPVGGSFPSSVRSNSVGLLPLNLL